MGVHVERRPQMVQEMGPTDLGLSAVDLKAIATTVGNLVDLRGFASLGLSVVYTIVGTTPTVGTAKLQAILFAEDGTTQLSEPIDVVTIVSTQAAGTYRIWVGWSDSLAPVMQAYAAAGTFTIGANLGALRAMGNVKFQLAVSAAYDQTGAKTASVFLEGAIR